MGMRAVVFGSVVLAAAGCQVGDLEATGGSSTGGPDAAPDPASCEGPLGPPILDFSGMEACCQDLFGEAHCMDAAQVPEEIAGYVSECAGGGLCIPDQFLKTGGSEPPKACTAFGGAGVCLSICVPQVAENAGLLQPDVCDGDQLCVPCISPLDQMPTGACDLAEFTTCADGSGGGGGNPPPAGCDDPATCVYEPGCPPVIEPSTLPECAADAHCLDAALVPGEFASQLAPCTDATKLCVPDKLIATGGKFAPAVCTSVAGAEGRCLSMALPAVADQADLLPQATCDATERCSPCYSPLDGSDTGACGLTCDTGPTQPPVQFASCCEDRARCVPTASIPPEDQEQLGEDDCAAGNLCVPNEILADGPFPTCSANSLLLGNYTGVCLSECLEFGIQGLALAQGNCGGDYKCVPCEQFGSPTGAPGCPETP